MRIIESGGLAGAAAAALRGTSEAAARFAASADAVAASGLPIAPVPEAGRAPPPDPATAAGLLDAQAGADGLVAGAVDGELARRAYEANLGVLRAADEMTGAALRMLGRDAPRS